MEQQKQENGVCPSKPLEENEEKPTEETTALISQGQYGWFNFNPRCLQVVNNACCFMILITVTNIFQSGTINGLMGAVQSSIERRFQLTSTQSSWIIIVYEIANVPLFIFITYKGTVGCHKPRWASGFLFISVLGSLLYSLPHFTTDVYLPEGEDGNNDGPENMCRNRTGEDSSNCDKADSSSNLQYYIIVFILGRIGLSFGASALYMFCVIYLDDSVTRDKFSLYTSMLALGGVLGPALGFIMGGFSLSLYTDFPSVEKKDIHFDEDDPRWVGAWWLAYIIAGFGILLTTLPMTGYPRDLPGAEEMRLKKKNEASGTVNDDTVNQLKINFGMKDVPRYLKDLFTNWSFVFLTMFVCCDMAILSGFTIFGPKYVEVSFSLTAADAGILFGALVVPAGVVGTVGGGLIVERLKLTYQRIVLIQLVVSVTVTCTVLMFLIQCDQIQFAGVNVGYNSSQQISLTDACSSQCMCEEVQFSPVCSHDHVQYFSACHAGCTNYTEHDTTDLYNCSCIAEVDTTAQATLGICDNPSCKEELILFSVVIFVAMVGLFMCEAMNISSVIRVVPNSHRLFAIMCEGFLVRCLGTTPGPVIFGSAFDAACQLWYTPCNSQGRSCFHYDSSYLGYYMLISCGSLKLGSCLFMFLAWKLYRPPPIQELIIEVNGQGIEDDETGHTAAQNNGYCNSGIKLGDIDMTDTNSIENGDLGNSTNEHILTRL